MPLNKLLIRIRASVKDLTPALEPFRDEDAAPPSLEECAVLQQRLTELFELVSGYKFLKQDNGPSQSFNLHARISETAENMKQEVVPKPEPPPAEEPAKTEAVKSPEPPPAKHSNGGGRNTPKALYIGINDKFRFINELFAHNDAEYNIAIEQLSNLKAWPETELYLASLKNLYGWKESHDAVKYFYNLVKRRFQ